MFRSFALFTAVLIAATMPLASDAAPSKAHSWVAAWTAAPLNGTGRPGLKPVVLSNQTIQIPVTLNASGDALRLHLSNDFGATAVRIGAVSVATASSPDRAGLVSSVTFSNAGSSEIRPGAPLMSDPIHLRVSAGETVYVRIYLPDETTVTTMHAPAFDTIEVSSPGDFSHQAHMDGAAPLAVSMDPNNSQTFPAIPFLSGVDVEAQSPSSTIIAFGDSITDGYASTIDAKASWPSKLAARLRAANVPVSIVNQGISGNQLLSDLAGQSALSRFDRDAISLTGVSAILLLEGTNDIGLSANFLPGISPKEIISVEQLKYAYLQLIARAHAKGIAIVGGTITPFEGSPTYTLEKESVRVAINAWIRTNGAFDAVIDFDAALRDPSHPTRLLAPFDSGDHIHPNDAGYDEMAKTVDLSTLKQWAKVETANTPSQRK